MKKYLVCIFLMLLLAPIGCKEKSPAEKVSERTGEIIDNIQDGDAPLKNKGTMEKLGESVDDSIKNTEKKLD